MIDPRLIDARPEDAKGNDAFVKSTMQAVAKAKTAETFSQAARTADSTKQGAFSMKLQNFNRWFRALPRLAAVALVIGSTGTVGAAAYATYQWVTPKTTVKNVQPTNDDKRKEYTIDGQCGEYFSGKDLKYEVAQNAGVTDEQVRKVFQNTCDYDAVSSFIGAHWKSDNDSESSKNKKPGIDTYTIYSYDNAFAGGQANQVFGATTGKVTAITPTEVTFELTIYKAESASAGAQQFVYYPEGKVISRTLKIAKDVQVWQDGKRLSLADVQLGDTIQVVNRAVYDVKYYEDIKQNSLGGMRSFEIAGIIKTNIDTAYVSGGAGAQIGNPAITNTIAGLQSCYNNVDFYCVVIPNSFMGLVYGTGLAEGTEKSAIDDTGKNALQIDGRITMIEGDKVTLQTRGKPQTFTVQLPEGSIAKYNSGPAAGVDASRARLESLKVGVGDLISVIYAQPKDANHLDIKTDQVRSFGVVSQEQPDGSFIKY